MIMLRVFLSTLSLRRATAARSAQDAKTAISIHALLAESDECWPQRYLKTGISIHALLAESDANSIFPSGVARKFLSTLSLRRATFGCHDHRQNLGYFYPRSPCGERRYWLGLPRCHHHISIHALLAESDEQSASYHEYMAEFLSTLSLRRATKMIFCYRSRRNKFLSTLSLRRATGQLPTTKPPTMNFYPRSPCGERQTFIILPKKLNNFYPRSPCGERLHQGQHTEFYEHFYPRSPCGERRGFEVDGLLRVRISIHALLAESDGTTK